MMRLCQGNGCEPQIWSIISSILFSALFTQGFGIHFVKSFTTEISQLVGFIFVDDYVMIQSGDYIEATFSQMKIAVSEWEYLMIITVGCLAPHKNEWYLVDYKRIRAK